MLNSDKSDMSTWQYTFDVGWKIQRQCIIFTPQVPDM